MAVRRGKPIKPASLRTCLRRRREREINRERERLSAVLVTSIQRREVTMITECSYHCSDTLPALIPEMRGRAGENDRERERRERKRDREREKEREREGKAVRG